MFEERERAGSCVGILQKFDDDDDLVVMIAFEWR